MKKRGFTLIELLAVIVILAIIAFIAVPIVMNIIENSKKGAAERSAENYIAAVETAVATERIDNKILDGIYKIQNDGNLCLNGQTCTDETEITIDMSGNKPIGGTIVIENGQVVSSLSSDATKNTTITTNDDYTVSYNNGKLEATKVEIENSPRVVYRWSTEPISLNQQIDPTDTTEFTTDPKTLGKNFYLKYEVENNIVTAIYICAMFDTDEACVRGGSPDFYGWAENPEDYTGNAAILKEFQSDAVSCDFSAKRCTCSYGSISLTTLPTGLGSSTDGSDFCGITIDNSSYCLDY